MPSINRSLVAQLNERPPHPSPGSDADAKHAVAVCRAQFKGPDEEFKLSASQEHTIDAWLRERGKLRAWGVRPPRQVVEV